jgi:hypothetical protein
VEVTHCERVQPVEVGGLDQHRQHHEAGCVAQRAPAEEGALVDTVTVAERRRRPPRPGRP